MSRWAMARGMAAAPGTGPGWRALARSTFARRLLVLVALAAVWQAVAVLQDNPIMLPSFTETAVAMEAAIRDDGLLSAVGTSLRVLLKGYVISVLIALVLVAAVVSSTFLREALQTLTAMLNPLPAIALLPLALLWFGLGETSLLFVLGHSVIWPFALATLTGFQTVPETQRLVGRNYGLRGAGYVLRILVPAALPSLLSGLKIAWAFAWRTLIAAELVFGVSSGSGGLGWFIFRNRNELFTDKVFAGLAAVILIGLIVEVGLFRTIEDRTVRRWGMQR